MIIDAFILFDEMDMLEFRLRMLWDHVDRFVIVESDRTFTGKEKPYNYLHNRHRFDWAKDKIIYYQMHGSIENDAWKSEHTQREKIISSCSDFAADDILIISDIDEIPNPATINLAQSSPCFMPFACQQAFFYYNLKTLRNELWKGSIFSTVGWARLSTIRLLRDNRNVWPSIRNAGWHLSYFGGVEKIQKKIEAFSHQEYNTSEFNNVEHIEDCIENGSDLFKRGTKSINPPSEFFPPDFTKYAQNYKWGLE